MNSESNPKLCSSSNKIVWQLQTSVACWSLEIKILVTNSYDDRQTEKTINTSFDSHRGSLKSKVPSSFSVDEKDCSKFAEYTGLIELSLTIFFIFLHASNDESTFLFQISVSTVSTRRFSRAGTPSSILSSDSDIRFTRKLGGQYRCGCCVLAAFLLFLLFSGVSIYLGCKYNTRVSDYLRKIESLYQVAGNGVFV